MQSSGERLEHRRQVLSPAWLAAGAVALVILTLMGFGLLAQPSRMPVLGEPVPDFDLASLSQGPISLEAQTGQVVVVNFFASWCQPCRSEAPDLERTWHKYRDMNVQFFGIAYKDADSKAKAFLEEFGVTFPCAVEAGNKTARAYGVTGVPETFVINREGLLVSHFVGPVSEQALSQAIEGALTP